MPTIRGARLEQEGVKRADSSDSLPRRPGSGRVRGSALARQRPTLAAVLSIRDNKERTVPGCMI